MAAYSITNGKVFTLSVLTISSATLFYWIFWRRKDGENKAGVSRNKSQVFPPDENKSKIASDTDENIYTVTAEQDIYIIRALVSKLKREDHGSREELRNILQTILKTTAFTQQQVYFLGCGGVSCTANQLTVKDEEIQVLVLQIMNNMALNKESQEIIKNYIPQLSDILINGSSDNLILKSLQVLTNLSVLDDHHSDIVQQISYKQWTDLLNCKVWAIQLQTLKILVNLSTNLNNIDMLTRYELLHPVSNFISPSVGPDLCLRSITFLANILTATQRLQNTSMKSLIVSIPGLQENIRLLTASDVEDIRFHASRATTSMT